MMRDRLFRRFAVFLAAVLLLPSFTPSLSAAEPVSRQMADYTGAGTVIAVIDAGFDVTHKVFSQTPENPNLSKADVARVLGSALSAGYLSEKIPLSLDYAALADTPLRETESVDTDVSNISDLGTSAAAIAGGSYKGTGDIEGEDGTVYRDADFFGAAPDAQLLLMKAARDFTSDLIPAAVSAAISDAVRLEADVILLNQSGLTLTDSVLSAVRHAHEKGIPLFLGAGDVSAARQKRIADLPASVTDRGTLPALAGVEGVYLIGAAADPCGHIFSFKSGEDEIIYVDSSLLYLGKSFARVFAGQTVSVVPVPGVGAPIDYEGLSLTGKIALVRRGEISFAEKAKTAAAAGAVGMIVADNGDGIVQMALGDTEIPAVMITKENGDLLFLEGAPGEITLAPEKPGAASFSARGVTSDFDAALTLLCPGENVRCPTEDGFTYRSGTHLAAAKAAGYCARAVEYMQAAGIRSLQPALLLSSAAQPLMDADGIALSPRDAGAGILTGEETFPGAVSADESGRAVSTPVLSADRDRCTVVFSVTNTEKTAVRYTASAAFRTEEIGEDGMFTGKSIPVDDVQVTLSGSTANIADGKTAAVTVPPGRTVWWTAEITLPEQTAQTLRKKAVYGYFLDGTITLTGAEETVRHGVTVFWGDPGASPLADATVYDKTDAVVAPSYLSVRMKNTGSVEKIGIADRTAETPAYDEAYNLVSPLVLREGVLEANVTVLRDLDCAAVRVLDEDGRVLLTHETKNIERYITTGTHAAIPIWNFAAADDPSFLFPDGVYYCEIRLTADGGESVQYLGFSLRADGTRPEIGHLSAAASDDGTITLTVEASDNCALMSVSVYDLTRQYRSAFLSGTSDSCTLEIEGYGGESPLYIEVTDAAGAYRTARITAAQLAAMTAGTP